MLERNLKITLTYATPRAYFFHWSPGAAVLMPPQVLLSAPPLDHAHQQQICHPCPFQPCLPPSPMLLLQTSQLHCRPPSGVLLQMHHTKHRSQVRRQRAIHHPCCCSRQYSSTVAHRLELCCRCITQYTDHKSVDNAAIHHPCCCSRRQSSVRSTNNN